MTVLRDDLVLALGRLYALGRPDYCPLRRGPRSIYSLDLLAVLLSKPFK